MKTFDLGPVTAYAIAVKNGFQGTEKEWIDSLGGKVKLDTTLTEEGVAADAKAVGDALDELEKKIPEESGGVSDYTELTNKPKINGVELSGNKTSADLGIGNPTEEQVSNAVSAWLDEHPEATTTVPDGSISPEKTTWLRCTYTNEYNTEDADAQDGYFFYSDSNAGTSGGGTAAYSVSGFIPVVAGKQYCFNYVRKAKWLDSSKAFIATLNSTNAPNHVQVAPENAAYVRFDVTAANKEKAFFYEYCGVFYDYSAYHTEKSLSTNDTSYDNMLVKSVQEMFANGAVNPERTFPEESVGFKQITGVEEFHWNIVNPNMVEMGIINNRTGAEEFYVDSATTKYRRTAFIPVNAGETYYAIGFSMYTYDADKNFIGGISLSANGGVIVMPDGVAYVRGSAIGSGGLEPVFNIYHRGYGRNNIVWDAGVDYSEYVPVFKNETTRKGFGIHLGLYPWGDKKFCFIGDSFSAPGVWQAEMCNRLMATVLANPAVSGGRWSDTANVPCAYEQAQSLVSDGHTPDVVFCTLGANDCSNTIQMGDIIKSTEISDFDLTTYTGGMQACLNYLQNNFPDAVIYVGWTPAGANCNYGEAEVVEPYIERMKEVCLMYGVKYLETRTCGITKYSAVYADCFEAGTNGGHPTNAGHLKIGEYMSRLI